MIALEYGSKHNGIVSRYSDRDLLLIHKENEYVKDEKIKLQLQGYDITMMSEKKAIHLAKSGSLFIKHIIDEAKIISGNSDSYRAIGNAWNHRQDYQPEIDSNVDILELLCYLPMNKYSLLFANDLIITTIRNVSIRMLAGDGKYIFSWEEIFNNLHNRCLINSYDVKLLLLSRRIKNAYRTKIFYDIDVPFVMALNGILLKILGSRVIIGFCSNKKYILSLPDRFIERSYKQLRAYEIICSFYQYSNDIREMANLVSKPSYFANDKIGNNVG